MTAAPLPLTVVESGTGRPVLFQHGLCGDARQPAAVFPIGAFRCLTIECRGHGTSAVGDMQTFGITNFAGEVASVLDSLNFAPLPVGGISMGAALALRLAVVRPDLVSALILARPAWVTAPAPPNMRPNAEIGSLLAKHDPKTARALFDASNTAAELAENAPDNLASLRSFFARAPLVVTAALLTRIAADGPGVSRAQVRAIRVPTLVIGHHRDCVHPLAMAEELAALIPGATLAVITPKADDGDRYRHDFQTSLELFLKEHCP